MPLSPLRLVGTITLILALCPFAWSALHSPGVDSVSVSDTDWPWWRGPSRDGHAPSQSVPLQWSEDQNVVWKTDIPGRGHASPVIIGDRVFLATADEGNQSQHLICIDKRDGGIRWSTQIHEGGWEGRIHARNTQASSTVASDGERVFTVFMHDSHIWLSALDFEGKILWQRKASDFASHWGYSTSPAIYKNLIIVGSDHKEGGNLSAFDRTSGNLVWNTPRPAIPNYASPVVHHLDGKDQLLVPGCELMASYDPNSGKELWSTAATTRETVGSVVTDGRNVFASGGYPKNETSCITADGTAQTVWTSPIRVYAPSMIVVEGFLYAVTDTGLAHCWNASNGELMWREKVGGDFSASPTLINGNLIVSSEQGKTIVFKANPERFELLAENQLGNEIWASPALSEGKLYLRVAHTDENSRRETLYCIGN